MTPRRRSYLPFLLVLGIALSCGCARWNLGRLTGTTNAKFFTVKSSSTAFYLHGPQQGGGPDKTLARDTIVSLIRRSFGFSKVKLITGEQGYVWNDDIAVASPALIAAANSAGATSPEVTTQPTPPDPRVVPFQPLSEFEPTPIPEPPATP